MGATPGSSSRSRPSRSPPPAAAPATKSHYGRTCVMPYRHKVSSRLALIKGRVAVAAAAALVAGAAVACERALGTTEPSLTVSRLVVSPKSVVLPPSQALYFLAVGLMPAGDTATVTVTWGASGGAMLDTSTNKGVHYGHYKAAAAPGRYNVIAAAQPGGKADTAVVTVSSVSEPSVTGRPATATLQAGQTVQLTATPQDASGTPLSGRVVTWASSNPAAATVSASGVVTGVRSEEHTSELQSLAYLVCRLLLEKKKKRGCDTVDDSSQRR